MCDLSSGGILAVWLVSASLASAGLLNPNPFPTSQALEKRSICSYDVYGNTYTCLSGYQCCYGRFVAGCIPMNSICCDMGTWLGWCPVGAICGTLDGYPACIDNSGQTVVAQTVAAETTLAATTASTAVTTTSVSTGSPANSSNSSGGGLSKGAIIGIAVSVTCSVLGLIVGIWIKYHFSKKAANKGQVPG